MKRIYSEADEEDDPVARERFLAQGGVLRLASTGAYIFGSNIDSGRPFTFLPKDKS